MSRLILHKLYRCPGRQPILDLGQVIEISTGELVVLVGQAGAGKTVLARMLCGLEPCDGGQIELGGRSLSKVPPHQRRVGYVMQGDALWPHWSLSQNISFPLRCRGIGRKARNSRLRALLADAALEDLADLKPDQVSLDARGRAILARAVALEPDVLVIDEPFDQAGPLDQIRLVHEREKLTTLILTRNVRQALSIADRVGLLSAGRLLQWGAPLEVYLRPESEEVARSFGPINILDGELESVDSRGTAVVRTVLGRLTGRLGTDRAVSAGDPVRLLFRPESLAHGTTGFGTNRFAATIDQRILDGPICHLGLRGPGGWRGAAAVLSVQAAGLKEAQAASFSLPAESVTVLLNRSDPLS